MAAWQGIVPCFDATWHEITDIEVVVSGDRATASSKVDGRHWLGERVWRPIGRYEFELIKRDGRWLVNVMRLVLSAEIGDRGLVAEAQVLSSKA